MVQNMSTTSATEKYTTQRKGIIHGISKVAELENPPLAERHNFSGEQPTLADLLLPGTGYKFSDEFACVLRVLSGQRDFA